MLDSWNGYDPIWCADYVNVESDSELDGNNAYGDVVDLNLEDDFLWVHQDMAEYSEACAMVGMTIVGYGDNDTVYTSELGYIDSDGIPVTYHLHPEDIYG